ncbi:hypothetical protein C3432_19455 [Citrobacter amalonaticus]|uniref:DUF930 domain-containing protein n=1 Tax=Citrobacter amalonaticus TaxID=35703 RepID=A0A2S4RXQ3_CITAM|nr:hypothetical protein [Citrobacter amalonaticus]POT56154.1 hypothetical protein C3432_19455 [Citrobacter amalonaticus]POT74463.1 hypothetical protein C3436_17095 [Citrobacter amalonaticus]POU65262.1 hypothetical protein C3430_13835 [Citrobacter amalonaticus]POV04097.1 hypothetical protein C3424_18775 [Citrobacter amalonaticus]
MKNVLNISRSIKKFLIFAAVWSCAVGSACADEHVLNPAQSSYLHSLIKTELRNLDDQNYVNSNWTEAQRVAEFICRPLAQKYVKSLFPKVDKVIMDQGKTNKQRLISSTRLTGNGQYRSGNSWTPFDYECQLSEKTGKALKFNFLSK